MGISSQPSYNNSNMNIRLYIVFPKVLSRTDAIALITSTNFPLYGMPDQDNWIYFKDKTYVTGVVGGLKRVINFKWSKKFMQNHYFVSNTVAEIPKPVFVIWSSNYEFQNTVLGVQGYTRMSFIDT